MAEPGGHTSCFSFIVPLIRWMHYRRHCNYHANAMCFCDVHVYRNNLPMLLLLCRCPRSSHVRHLLLHRRHFDSLDCFRYIFHLPYDPTIVRILCDILHNFRQRCYDYDETSTCQRVYACQLDGKLTLYTCPKNM